MTHALHWPQIVVLIWWAVATLSNVGNEISPADKITAFFANMGAKGFAAFILWQGGFF